MIGQKESIRCRYRLFKNNCNREAVLDGYCMYHYCVVENQKDMERERTNPLNGARCAIQDGSPLRKSRPTPQELDDYFLSEEL